MTINGLRNGLKVQAKLKFLLGKLRAIDQWEDPQVYSDQPLP